MDLNYMMFKTPQMLRFNPTLHVDLCEGNLLTPKT